MPHQENMCEHFNSVIDEREGSVICTECGLVLEEKLFKFYGHNFSFKEKAKWTAWNNCKSLKKQQAMKQYIKLVNELLTEFTTSINSWIAQVK